MSFPLRTITALFVFILINFPTLKSQEINCNIQINTSQISGSNKTVFEAMQTALFEFLNNKIWTNHVFGKNELIECSFLLNLTTQHSADDFEGSLQITSNRPVYNSGYSTPMLNIKDEKIRFRYAEGEILEFNETSHSELTSLFAYYIYIVIGYDYDSFSPQGGSEFYKKAETIVTNAQSSPYSGWKAYESKRNRYWLTENLLNPVYAPIRNYSYKYHREGLDKMVTSVSDGRTNIAEGLSALSPVHRSKPNSYIMQLFFEAKADEIVNILKEAPTSESMRAINYLKEVNQANSAKYQTIIKK